MATDVSTDTVTPDDSVSQMGLLATHASTLQIGSTRPKDLTGWVPQRRRDSEDSSDTLVLRNPPTRPDRVADLSTSGTVVPDDSAIHMSASTYSVSTASLDYDLDSKVTVQPSVASLRLPGIVT